MTKLFRGRRVKFTKTQKGWWLEDEGVIANDRKRPKKKQAERARERESRGSGVGVCSSDVGPGLFCKAVRGGN